MKWYCSDCTFVADVLNLAMDHAERGSGHVLFERTGPSSPAVRSTHASDSGGCYVDSKPGGMLDMDKYRVLHPIR